MLTSPKFTLQSSLRTQSPMKTMCQLPDCLNIDDLEVKEHGAHLMKGNKLTQLGIIADPLGHRERRGL